MPSTVQSSIAFTAMGKGNVSAAICSAALSNVLGVVVTPLLIGVLFARQGGDFSGGILKITAQLLVPFVAGHLMRPLLLKVLDRDKALLGLFDRGVILLVVYTAFSAAVVEGLWQRYSLGDLAWQSVR
jgi:sodium/bile acid cotransporter 7